MSGVSEETTWAGQFADPQFLSTMIELNNCVCRTLLAADDVSLATPSAAFASFPEFSVYELSQFIPLARSVIVSAVSVGPILEFLVRGMESSNRITNKHLRGQLAEALASLPAQVLVGSDAIVRDLAKACISVWVAVEETGRHNQWHARKEQKIRLLF